LTPKNFETEYTFSEALSISNTSNYELDTESVSGSLKKGWGTCGPREYLLRPHQTFPYPYPS